MLSKRNIASIAPILCVLPLLFTKELSKAQTSIYLETGIVYTGYNNVGIPGNSGTRISLKNNLTCEPKLHFRAHGNFCYQEKHHISLLYAPLKIISKGNLLYQVYFAGEMFSANKEITASYKFNSYRISYRYDAIKTNKINLGFGITAKVRDARIELSSENKVAGLSDLGIVPLINFKLNYFFHEKFGLLLEGDALAVKFGRAEDVLFGAKYKFSDYAEISAGYRILEGGSNGTAVYTFALFHYAVLGLTINLESQKKNNTKNSQQI